MKEKGSLFSHINFFHSSNKEPFNCLFCEGKFDSELQLRGHLQIEHQTSMILKSKRFEIEQDGKVATFHYEVQWVLFYNKYGKFWTEINYQ